MPSSTPWMCSPLWPANIPTGLGWQHARPVASRGGRASPQQLDKFVARWGDFECGTTALPPAPAATTIRRCWAGCRSPRSDPRFLDKYRAARFKLSTAAAITRATIMRAMPQPSLQRRSGRHHSQLLRFPAAPPDKTVTSPTSGTRTPTTRRFGGASCASISI